MMNYKKGDKVRIFRILLIQVVHKKNSHKITKKFYPNKSFYF